MGKDNQNPAIHNDNDDNSDANNDISTTPDDDISTTPDENQYPDLHSVPPTPVELKSGGDDKVKTAGDELAALRKDGDDIKTEAHKLHKKQVIPEVSNHEMPPVDSKEAVPLSMKYEVLEQSQETSDAKQHPVVTEIGEADSVPTEEDPQAGKIVVVSDDKAQQNFVSSIETSLQNIPMDDDYRVKGSTIPPRILKNRSILYDTTANSMLLGDTSGEASVDISSPSVLVGQSGPLFSRLPSPKLLINRNANKGFVGFGSYGEVVNWYMSRARSDGRLIAQTMRQRFLKGRFALSRSRYKSWFVPY
jgi:hypothetical protein